MTEDCFSDEGPWGIYRPRGWGGLWLKISRAFPGGWPWSRFALLSRRFARYGLGDGPVDTLLWGHRLRLFPRRSVSEGRILFLPRSWDRAERRFLGKWMTPGFTFVDVGANVGAYSFWVASRMDGPGQVVAVEPDPALARQLRFNVRINDAEDRIRIVEAAVGRGRGMGKLIVNPDNSGRNRLARGEVPVGETLSVRAITLADVVREGGLDRIDCVKIDVEGHEGDVLRPFFSGTPRSGWPRILIVELRHASRDLEGEILALGYRRVFRTKLNGVFRLE